MKGIKAHVRTRQELFRGPSMCWLQLVPRDVLPAPNLQAYLVPGRLGPSRVKLFAAVVLIEVIAQCILPAYPNLAWSESASAFQLSIDDFRLVLPTSVGSQSQIVNRKSKIL